ncbi:hypothetical protein DPMN_177493 [Dreissena polymorpha]|uniref:Methionyl/Leucyl tRNA synthetase domain-containing protein n=1 Tax=Dreissena polymorpha TaxID=45954 RepID=A0A9D4EB92_DREPO|nr:hypothetical protein DPMN_177493 [Dreissena polymorpha]
MYKPAWQCAKVTLLSELIKGPPPDWQQLSRKIQIILETLTKLENIGNTNMQSSQLSYNNQLDEIRQTRQKINTILDKIEKNTIKELDDKMTTLKASIQTDLDNCIKLKNELKQLSDAIHAIVDKGQAELSFIATKKCLEKIKLSKTFLKKNAVQAERSLTFQADTDITQFFSKRLGLGRILFNYPDKVFTVQRKSEYDVRIPSDSKSCDITANCVLSSDQILVTDDKNQCVKLLDLQYQVVGHCDLNAHPSDMCQITPSQVAVTMYKKKTHEVQFVSVNGGQLVKGRKLQFQHNVLGIANSQKDLYITDGTALYKYSMSGGLLGTVYLDLSGELTVWKCAVSQIGDKIYVINCSHHKVITLARDGYRVLCTFTDPDLQLPSFIHVTAQGQVLVCGASSHTLLQLNGEGRKNLATLVTMQDSQSYVDVDSFSENPPYLSDSDSDIDDDVDIDFVRERVDTISSIPPELTDCRLRNYNTLYICGTDEYGTATETKAIAEGLTPQQICDKYSAIDSAGYILAPPQEWLRTHNSVEQLHCENCDRLACANQNQCDVCGKLINAMELVNPKCKLCGNRPKVRSSEHFFLDLPKAEHNLQDHQDSVFHTELWTNNAKVITKFWIRDA